MALAVILRGFDFEMVPGKVRGSVWRMLVAHGIVQEPGMTTGATIHTQNGMYMYVKERVPAAVPAVV